MPETPINKIISIALALGLFFILLSYFVFEQFSNSYRFAQSTCWTNTTANCDYDATINTTKITAALSCGATEFGISGSMCQRVLTAGGYRSINQGIMLLLFVAGMVAAVLILVKYK